MNKCKTIIHSQKHLTLSDRTYIEQELLQGSNFSSIAATLHKDPITLSKEVHRYAKEVFQKSNRDCIVCKHYADCDIRNSEMNYPSYNNKYYSFQCKKYYRQNPTKLCIYFIPFTYTRISKVPYVCNACDDQKSCPILHKVSVIKRARKHLFLVQIKTFNKYTATVK